MAYVKSTRGRLFGQRRIRNGAVAVATIAAWAVLAVDAVLDDSVVNVTDGQSMLAACVAVAGSLTLAGWARSRPVTEVYEMGYEVGKRQARTERAMKDAAKNVVRFRRRA